MRGVLYGEDGKPWFTHRVLYRVQSSGEIVEQSPDDWKNALIGICRKAAGEASQIGALALTSQRSSIIPVDEMGEPLRNAIMWQDTRNAGIVHELAPHAEHIAALTGAGINTVFSGTKMTWFRRFEPVLYERTHKILTIADYLTFLITGEFVTDETYGSRSLLMGLRSRKWEPDLLQRFEVEEEKLCRIVKPGCISGTVKADFSKATGIPEGIPLISAGGDQQCGALGQGIFSSSVLAVTLGTSACLLKHIDEAPGDLKGIICGAHAVPESFILEGSMLTCGAMFDWVRRTFSCGADYGDVDKVVAASRPGANGVTVVPHFQGRGTPDWNSTVRGGFLNLNLGTTRADMVRAALESIAYEIVNNIENMEALSGPSDMLRVGGGFAKNRELCRILADASGKTVLRGEDNAEDTSFGAWMSAAVTMGLCGSYEEAFERASVPSDRTEPESGNFEIYQQGRMRMNAAYAKLYGSIR